MSNLVVVQPQFSELERMAEAVVNSKLFGVQNKSQAIALMLIAQSEGRHPATVARDYDIIQGKPSKKTEAMLRDFLQSGGSVEWHELTDTKADATFSHPQGGKVRIDWDLKRAQVAGLAGKGTWKSYPRQMLRSRVVSEGIRTVCPMATSGMYVPEEVADFKEAHTSRVEIVKPAPKPDFAPGTDPVLDADFKDVKAQGKPWEKAEVVEMKSHNEKATAALMEKSAAVDQIKETLGAVEVKEHELATFAIPGGPHKGIKLGDKPDAFWEQYVVELRGNIAKIATDKQAIAQDTIDAITLYLKRA